MQKHFCQEYTSDNISGKIHSPGAYYKKNHNKEKIPHKVAVVELKPGDKYDAISFDFLSHFSLKRKRFAGAIFDDFAITKNGKTAGNTWVKYYAIAEEQDSYKYLRAKNILGLAEVSLIPPPADCIYLNYLQTVKRLVFNKYCDVGTETLNFLKKTYPDKDIVLRSLKSTKKFYIKNDFSETENGKKDGLVEMRYSHKFNA